MNKKPKVFVGVSGGVDSSVSLALLKQKGYDVTGVFLKVWSPDFLPCDWKEERRSAMRVCATLDVPFLTFDFEKEYKKEVVDYMIREYKSGRVPNPDVFCNKYVKFGSFLKKALEMGADYVATGHYAEVYKKNGVFELIESKDKEKDQTYFLYTLGQEELKHTLFPIGGMIKSEVRELARKFNLSTAEKKDSQGLCFIGKIDMKDFLSYYIKTNEGDVLNTKGEVVGKHDGAIFLTIGQRHGFTITKKTGVDPRYFVVSKDLGNNTVTVASKELEPEKIYSTKKIIIKNLHLISGENSDLEGKVQVRIRYRQEKQDCKIVKKDDSFEVFFEKEQSGVAVGQSAVFYNGEVCLGGGVIEKTD